MSNTPRISQLSDAKLQDELNLMIAVKAQQEEHIAELEKHNKGEVYSIFSCL